MKKNSRGSGRAMTVPGGLAYSGMQSLGLTILLSGMTALSLHKGFLPIEKSGYVVMMILFFVAVTGGITTAYRIKHQILAVCIASGIVYFLILLSITAIFFGGQYCGVGETGIVIAAGTLTAAVISLKKASWSAKKR